MAESLAAISRSIWFKFGFALVLLFAFIGLLGYGIRYVDRQMAEQHAVSEERLFAQQVHAVEIRYSAGIEFYDVDGTDEKLARLKPLPYLYLVSFHQTAVSAKGLRHLARQPNLKAIAFDEQQSPTPIWKLCCWHRRASNGEVSKWQLRFGRRHRSPASDEARAIRANCPQLRELTLEGSWFSDDAVEQLRNVLPDCEIHVERFETRSRE